MDGIPDFIYKGDRAKVGVELKPPLAPNEKVFIQIIPEYGNVCRLRFQAPDTMIFPLIELYP